jgi:hypothetical protein
MTQIFLVVEDGAYSDSHGKNDDACRHRKAEAATISQRYADTPTRFPR